MSTIYLNYFKNLKYFRYIYSSYSSIRNLIEKTEKIPILSNIFKSLLCNRLHCVGQRNIITLK